MRSAELGIGRSQRLRGGLRYSELSDCEKDHGTLNHLIASKLTVL
jgi:hypothetical protein